MIGFEVERHLGGYWNLKTPWGDPFNWAPTIWNKIIKDFSIGKVLDIGCGLGFSTAYFSNKGLYAVGVEGGINAINNSVFEGYLIRNDYTKSSANVGEFDLVWCCMMVQQVEHQYIQNVLEDFKCGKYLAVVHAEPGEEGHHYVNCKTREEWIATIESSGFTYDAEYTEVLRDMARGLMSNSSFQHGHNLHKIMFFVRHE